MGLHLKNALNKGNFGDGSLTPNQLDLKEILTNLWNNQDNLNKGDIRLLEYLSKK